MASIAHLPLPDLPPDEPQTPPVTRWRRALETFKKYIASQRGQLLYWVPVMFGCGSASYFALPFEPPIAGAAALLSAGLLMASLWRSKSRIMVPFLLILAGFVAAQLHSRSIMQPLIAKELPAAVYMGSVETIERRVEGGWRITLVGPKVPGQELILPDRIRLTVRTQKPETLRIGDRISIKAVLTPLPKPSYPGGYDFGRALYFKGIGATGYAVSPISVLTAAPIAGQSQIWDRARDKVRFAISKAIDADERGVALALLTGDRSGLSQTLRDAYRQAGLAHLLAISGLHMALIATLVFFAIRRGLAIWPRLALTLPLKACAAVSTSLALYAYLMLVGAPLSAQRAALMAAVAMLAIATGRDAISMRTAALAAMVLLLMRPSALLDIGFQMSFAAVIALIAGYEAIAPSLARYRSKPGLLGKPAVYIAGVLASTILAELAIFPISLYHFNEVTTYGLAGNALAVPLTGFVIMPAGLLGLILMPFGLSEPAFWMMAQGIALVNMIATDISQQPFALLSVRRFSMETHGLLIFAFLWLCLWKSRVRILSVIPLCLAVFFADPGPRPSILINQSGKSIALLTEEGDIGLAKGRSSSFVSDLWARANGQNSLMKLPPRQGRCDSLGCTYFVHSKQSAVGSDRHELRLDVIKSGEALRDSCSAADIIIAPFPIDKSCDTAALTLDQHWLDTNAPATIFVEGSQEAEEIVIKTTSQTGNRPWHPPSPSDSGA